MIGYMVRLDNPKTWISLHWKKGTLIQYFGVRNDDVKVNSFNVIRPSETCINSISDIIDNRQTCRISSLKINREDNKCCDNIIPLSDVAMLCGLPGTGYMHVSNQLLDELKMKSSNKDIYEQLKLEYSEYQMRLWSKIYSWSHQECHDIKREFPFLELDFRGGVTIGDVIKENIAKLISELVFIKLPKVPTKKRKTKKKGTRKKINMLGLWRKNVLSRYKILDMNKYGLDQLQSLTSEVEDIRRLLLSYEETKLQQFSYLSLCSILRMIINNTLELTKINWTNPLLDILRGSMKLEEYYTEDNISSESIYNSLLILQERQPELFQEVKLYPNDTNMMASLNDFYLYFRAYLNIDVLLINRLEGKDTKDTLSRQCIIDIIDYIWNEWSYKTNIKEAKIRGESSDLDRLSRGAQLDQYAEKYNNELFYISVLSSIGDKLTDKYQEIITEESKEESVSIDKMRQKKISKKELNELHSMEFRLGDKSFYSNLIRE